MRRVVVTGMGIVSSIGNNTQEVLASLHDARSGITFAPTFAEHGFRCQVYGAPSLDPATIVDRRAMRFHGGGTAWNHVAMDQAILDEEQMLAGQLAFQVVGAFQADGFAGGLQAGEQLRWDALQAIDQSISVSRLFTE